ncbi:MAG: hypothetical protein GX351_11705 [Peptococcaceae bacterium]|jgi:hypothetical protein|nr:hypothetical protein [Peptococcaceae bacterium]ODM27592.1 hypothetical protein A7W90_15985 [Clostridium sp. Bc-iso-3]
MFCPKCGSDIEEIKICPNCSSDLEKIIQSNNLTENQIISIKSRQKTYNLIIKFGFLGLAGVILIMFFIAANSISKGGMEIMKIQSVGGRTLEEAYYAELGKIYSGYAMITRTLGIFFASVMVWLGLKE